MEECQEINKRGEALVLEDLENPVIGKLNNITRYYIVAEFRNEGRALLPEAYMLVKNPSAVMSETETCFREIHGTCDTVCREF